MTTELRAISKRASEIEDSIEAIQRYSYNYNSKITGIPQKPGETALQSSEICVKLFQKIGASNVTLQDIDIAHRVPKRKMKRDYSEPPAKICKFTRRLAKNLILQQKKSAKNISPIDLGLHSQVPTKKIMIFEHLTPKVQNLLYKCKSFQRENDYKYCWVRNSKVFLRYDENSEVTRVESYEDLQRIH